MLFSGKICIKFFQIFFFFRTGQRGLTNRPYVTCFFSGTPLFISYKSIDCVKHIRIAEEQPRAKVMAIQPVIGLSSKFF